MPSKQVADLPENRLSMRYVRYFSSGCCDLPLDIVVYASYTNAMRSFLLFVLVVFLSAASLFAHDNALLSNTDTGQASNTQEGKADSETAQTEQQSSEDTVGNGDNAATASVSEQEEKAPDSNVKTGEELVTGTIGKGDTITKILGDAGSEDVQKYVSAARRVFSMRAFREGQPYIVITDAATGRVKRFEYEIDSHRRLIVEGLETANARVEAIEYTVLLSCVSAVIDDNLFQAVADVSESPQLAIKLADLFGSEINFVRDLQQGDAFSVLVEKRYRNGEYKGYGRILAARFINKGKKYEAFLFRDGNGPTHYYNRKGENLHKSFLQTPLAVTRITSRFSKNRMHPILGYSRPHEGVDYGAPTGTPVKAVGEGVISYHGWSGGYGNQVIVKHSGGLESMYSHLSGFARGLRNGQPVRQGQVIGFVGSTGLATGPHLDFRLRQGGKFINPSTAINPRGAPVSRKNIAAFTRTMEAEEALLKGEKPFSEYEVDSIVPERPLLPMQGQVQQAEKKRHATEKERKVRKKKRRRVKK